ncbi:DUF3313 domain-containing protein [Yokenella regensburgei]|uniref:DUF3313 domain-containing protein n=1 Tax=Yokenella regensburgei TaxID=158877 RepID=UPI0027D98E06|nr:DUF3313 family protein [Yokenella regensburgei]MDQ4429045.1 DUF3313 domain-containing protein [Yokenella regensburgei]
MKNVIYSVLVLLTVSVLSGCAGKYTEPENYSGFLKNYSSGQKEQSVSGVPVFRWSSPDFKTSNYDAVYILPIKFWPEIPVSGQAQQEKLQSILGYANRKLRHELKSRVPVVNKPGPRTLTLRIVITAVDVQKQGLNVWELMPVPALIAGAQYLTGYRTLDVIFYFEAEVTDSVTGKPLITTVRRSQSVTLSNSHKLLTVVEVKETIDELVSDFALYQSPRT